MIGEDEASLQSLVGPGEKARRRLERRGPLKPGVGGGVAATEGSGQRRESFAGVLRSIWISWIEFLVEPRREEGGRERWGARREKEGGDCYCVRGKVNSALPCLEN